MLIRRVLAQVLLIGGLVFLLTACGGGNAATQEAAPTNTPEPVVETQEVETAPTATENTVTDVTPAENVMPTETPSSSQSDGAIAGFSSGQRLLVWTAPAAAPGQQGASAAGELVYFDADGSTESILNLPSGTTRVTACGPDAESPDGNTFAFIATVTGGGVEKGTVYLVHGTDSSLITVATEVNPANCIGSAPLEYSPDSNRFAFIDWPDNASSMNSPFGRLHIYDSSDGNEIDNIENVTAFDLTKDGATYVSFYPDNKGNATDVAISTWDGSSNKEVASLTADSENDCRYTSASISEAGDSLIAVMGYVCTKGDNTKTQWRFFDIDAQNGTAQLEQSANTGGRYFAFSNTNAIFVAPDGKSVLFSVPDGVNNQSVSLLASSLDKIDPKTVLDRFGLMLTVSDKPYDANNATAIRSADGRWLAIVANDGNNNAQLQVFDLSDVSLPPISVDLPNQGDTVSSMVFAPDNSTLYFVAGGDAGDNNSLFSLNLTTGADERIQRGRYAQMAISPDGKALAIMNWVKFDEKEDPYLTLEIYELASNSETVIYKGGTVNADGKLENASFAYPLSWRG